MVVENEFKKLGRDVDVPFLAKTRDHEADEWSSS